MMKKKCCLLVVAVLSISSLAGCGGERTPSPDKENNYKNGTYNVQWASADPDGYTEKLQISIKDGKVTILSFDAVNDEGSRKIDDEELKQRMQDAARKNGRNETYPQRFYPDIISSYQKADGNLEEMENVAGATRSTGSFQFLLKELLAANCTTGEAKTLELPIYQDGEYTVSQPSYDENGYKEYLRIKVKDSRVSLEEYDAKDKDANLRSADSTTDYPVAPQELASKLITLYQSNGNVDEIENVAGATRSTNSFKELLNRAISNARFRGPNEDTLPVLKNGEYRAEMSTYENGWKDYVVLSVRDDKVTVKELDSLNEAGERKSEKEQLSTDMKASNKAKGGPEIGPAQAAKLIAENFQKANYQVDEMENVAGATVSTNNFKLMAGILMGYNVKTGDAKTVVVEPYGKGAEQEPAQEPSEKSSSSK